MRTAGWIAAMGAVGLWLGCGGGGGEPAADGPAPADDPGGVKLVAAADLPLGDPMPPGQDGGRVDVSTPRGWDFAPRDSKFVVRFHMGDINAMPRILITASDADYAQFDSVTPDNVSAFAAAVDKDLANQGVSLLEPVRAMVLGDVPVARYVRGGRFKNASVERQILVTRQNGRTYVIDLQVLPGTILTHRDAGYAAAASLKFHAREPAADPAPAPAAGG